MQLRLAQLLAAAALFAPPALAVPETVSLPYANYTGLALPNGITQWLGMRYAAPPTGNRRFRPPEDPEVETTAQSANSHGDNCLVTGHPANEPGHAEDCLFVDVQAPSNATRNSHLPVFVYIHGDGYNSTQKDTNINATHFLENNGNDFIVVTFNYRVGPYGFLTRGNGMATNNGIRDQLKALDWVAKFIRRFGGNPNHTILGGSGIGAQNVLIHLTMYNYINPYVTAIIAESPSFAEMRTLQEAEQQYHRFAQQLGCDEKQSLACLVGLPANVIQGANRASVFSTLKAPPWDEWLPVIDNNLIINTTSQNMRNRHFARVPLMIGNVVDTGTAFSFRNSSSADDITEYMHDLYPNLHEHDLDEIFTMYPNPNSTCDASACTQTRVRRAYQDSRYTCPALAVTEAMRATDVEPVYLYLWDVSDADGERGLAPRQNIEAAALWGPESGKLPDSYEKGGENELVPFVKQRYWSNFIRTLDPNRPRRFGGRDDVKIIEGKKIHFESWGTWWPGGRRRLVFKNEGKTEAKDTEYLRWRCSFWNRLAPRMHI
ncbi:hypothetical protein PWT90_09290 [Aphanocladium album]|nr:hypothetical protein PWT90_09290 [Aphanocladium album]